MRLKFAQTFMLLALAGLVACGGGSSLTPPPPPQPTLTFLAVTPFGSAVTVNSSIQLTATGTFSDGRTKDLTSSATWSSDAPGVASVSAGKVTGLALGVTRIKLNVGKVGASTPMNVTSLNLNNATLKGSYAFLISALNGTGQSFIVGSFSADGNGNITGGIADISFATGVNMNTLIAAANNAYSIGADGRGTAVLNINGIPYTMALIVSKDGKKGRMISYDKNISSGTFEQQDITVTALSGKFVFALSGQDPSAKIMSTVGAFDVVGLSGNRDVSIAGISHTELFSATLSGLSNTRGTATFANNNYAFYAVNSGKAFFIQTDVLGQVQAGVAEKQTAATLALPNAYSFLLDHAVSSTHGTFERTGQLSFDATGNITALSCSFTVCVEDGDVDNRDQPVTGGSIAVDAAGHGQLTYSVTTPTGMATHTAVIYVVDANHFMMMDSGSVLPGTGVAHQVQAGPIDNAPFMFTLSELGEQNLMELGQVQISGSAAGSPAQASGIAYNNNNGTLSVVLVGGTLPTSTGRSHINPTTGIEAKDTIVYVNSPSSGILLGVTPDVDGSLDEQ